MTIYTGWIEVNIRLGMKLKTRLLCTLYEKKIDGSYLVDVETVEDFLELGVTQLVARKLFKKLKEKFPNEIALSLYVLCIRSNKSLTH